MKVAQFENDAVRLMVRYGVSCGSCGHMIAADDEDALRDAEYYRSTADTSITFWATCPQCGAKIQASSRVRE